MNKIIDEIKQHLSNLEIYWIDQDKKDKLTAEEFADDLEAHGIDTIVYDGLQGELTQEEWLEDDIIQEYNNEDQQEILRQLKNTNNVDFFKE